MSTVPKSKRTLLVVSSLTYGGDPKLNWLYGWLDKSTLGLARLKLSKRYRRISTLTGSRATKSGFVSRLANLARPSSTQAIDVIIAVHALKTRLTFADGSITIKKLRNQIKAKGLEDKLRLLYSLCCYGGSHAQDFVTAGFRTASGPRKVNTNAAYDYPVQLIAWASGKPYKEAVKKGNYAPIRLVSDGLAKALYRFDADSFKIIKGKKLTKISSPAS